MTEGLDALPEGSVRVIAVTGAGSGIGRVLAQGFAEAGYSVAAVGRRMETLRDTAAVSGEIMPITADVLSPESCAEAFRRIEDELGSVDGLVAGAAVYPREYFLDQSPESFALTMRTNVEGVANTLRPALPGMLARNRGRVVVIGSLAFMNPIPAAAAYSASKGALHPLVRGIAGEIDRTRYPNVLINLLCPGATRTAMSAEGQAPEAVFPHVRALVEAPAGGPTGRFFQKGREVRPGETWKQAVKRMLLMRR